VAVDGFGFPAGADAASARIDLNGRGEGIAVTGAGPAGVFSSLLHEDAFFPGALLGFAASNGSPVGGIADNNDAFAAYVAADGTLRARPFDIDPRSRNVPPPGPEAVLSTPDFGPVDEGAGIDLAVDRGGNMAVAVVQGSGAERRLVVASFDRAPGSFTTYSSSKLRRSNRPTLTWQAPFELWGPLRYRVEVAGQVVGESTEPRLVPAAPLPDGFHRWRVVAIDRRGQESASKVRYLRIDARPPEIQATLRRSGGRILRVTATVADGSLAAPRRLGRADRRGAVGRRDPLLRPQGHPPLPPRRAVHGHRASHGQGRERRDVRAAGAHQPQVGSGRAAPGPRPGGDARGPDRGPRAPRRGAGPGRAPAGGGGHDRLRGRAGDGAGPLGRARPSGGPRLLRGLRAAADAVLAGTATLAAERYASLLDRDQRDARRGRGPRATPRRRSRSPARAPSRGTCRCSGRPGVPCQVYSDRPAAVPAAAAETELEVLPGPDLVAVLEHLGRARGVRSVACEGGPQLLRALVARAPSTTSCSPWPRAARRGGRAASLAGEELAPPARMRLAAAHRAQDHLFLRYVRDPG
jgi:5-amino-6-(5-phosphoribosylamino)uracil reductase